LKDTREKIILAAFKKFLDKGYENSSMNDLVKASQMSKGAFYHYFGNKEALLLATLEFFFLQYFQDLDDDLSDLEQALRNVWLPYAKMFDDLKTHTDDMTNYYRYIFTGFRYFPELQLQANSISQAAHSYLKEALDFAKKDKQIRATVDSAATADQLIRLIEGTGLLIGLEKVDNAEEQLENIVQGFVANLR